MGWLWWPTFHPSIGEAEEGGSLWVQGQFCLSSKFQGSQGYIDSVSKEKEKKKGRQIPQNECVCV